MRGREGTGGGTKGRKEEGRNIEKWRGMMEVLDCRFVSFPNLFFQHCIYYLWKKKPSIPKFLSRTRKYPKLIQYLTDVGLRNYNPLPSAHVKLWQLPQLTSFHSKLCPTPKVWTQSSFSLKSFGWCGAQYVKLLDWLPAQTNTPSVSLSFSPIQPLSPLRRCWT